MNFQKIIKSQQEALKTMGLYSGPIDGLWGLRSVSAMAGLQHHPSYQGCPGNPSNQPLLPLSTLPTCWKWERDKEGDFIVVMNAELQEKMKREAKELEEQLLKQAKEQEELAEAEALKKEAELQAQGKSEEDIEKSEEDIELENMIAEEEANKE